MTLSAAARIGGAVWIVGEAGTGTDHVAAALARAWDPEREPILWQETDLLASALAKLGDERRVLWAPALDERPLREQRAFERFLALEPARRVVITSADDPAAAVAAGTLLRTLHHALSRVAVRLPPLRERPGDIAPLAILVGNRVAPTAFGAFATECVELTGDARRTLESYPWPGNTVELEAVITRSVIAQTAGGSRTIQIDAAHLLFAPALSADAMGGIADHPLPGADDASAQGSAPAATLRRAVVVALGAAGAGRGAKSFDTASPVPVQAVEIAAPAPRHDAAHTGVEGVLAAFAHDLRNPLATIKTFAGLQAASVGDDNAELARLAVAECARVDEHLDFLQRYAELTPSAPALVDAVEILGTAIDAGAGAAALDIAARGSLWVHTDAALARFVADAVVAECLARAASLPGQKADAALADIAADREAIEIRIRLGGAAVDRLDKWVEGASPPWRLAIARDVARRAGGDLELETTQGELRLRWRLPLPPQRASATVSQGARKRDG